MWYDECGGSPPHSWESKMGLDITAYEKVVWNRAWEPDEDKDYDYHTQTIVYFAPGWADRAMPLEEGIYDIEGEQYGFCAGSYSGYNAWRSRLAELVYTTDEEVWNGKTPLAFGELIAFSGCEGTIGPEVSQKLAQDFEDWSERAIEFANNTMGSLNADRWLESYNDWKHAFSLAANNGVVSFH